MRRVIAFPCESETLLGTIDEGSAATGLLIVSGGNEIRAGAHRGMALLAQRLAADGTPVFRYDRRGVGDSSGENRGFASAAPDLAAALATFREEAGITRIVAFGNCDAASLLATDGAALGINAVVLANPWTVEQADTLPPAAAIHAGYVAKLRSPPEWWRLLTGGVNLRKLVRGLRKIANAPSQPTSLATTVVDSIQTWGNRATVVLAEGDATAIAYAALPRAPITTRVPTASHSFARTADAAALEAAIRAAIRRLPA